MLPSQRTQADLQALNGRIEAQERKYQDAPNNPMVKNKLKTELDRLMADRAALLAARPV